VGLGPAFAGDDAVGERAEMTTSNSKIRTGSKKATEPFKRAALLPARGSRKSRSLK